MDDNSRKFGGLAEENKSCDERGIHPPPVVVADDTSNRTSAVPGKDLPFSKLCSSDAAEKSTVKHDTRDGPNMADGSIQSPEVKKPEEETGGKDDRNAYVASEGANSNGVIEHPSRGGSKCKVPKCPILVLVVLGVMIGLIAVPTITLGLASPGGSEAKHDLYLGDTIMLFSVESWFWLESVLVKGEPALQDEEEVKLFSVVCDSVKGYTTFSHIEPGHSFDVAAPFPILDHDLKDISNYFATASGNITVNLTVWSKDLSELSLCYFDCYESYESYIQQSPKAKEKALNCTEYQSTAEPKTVVSVYSSTQPGYYFVAVAANSPFSLRYSVDLWREEFNRSDYAAENCSIIGGGSCEISLPLNYDYTPPELCILAYYLTGLEDFITLQAVTQHRFQNNLMLIVGCAVLLVLILYSCIFATLYCCYIIRCKFGKTKNNNYEMLHNTEQSSD